MLFVIYGFDYFLTPFVFALPFKIDAKETFAFALKQMFWEKKKLQNGLSNQIKVLLHKIRCALLSGGCADY